MKSGQVTAQKIAGLSGVSLTTVSYVLNGRDVEMKIAPATAARVRDTARRLQYRGNFLARSLARRKTGSIGVIFPDLSGSAAHEILQGLSEVLAVKEYDTLIGVNFWDPDRERREVELMLEKQVEGIIALPLVGGEAAYQAATDAGVPVVFVCDWLPKLASPSVAIDSVVAVRDLVRHLHAIGRRRIHMIAVDWDSACLAERESAFLNELKKLGVKSVRSQVHYSKVGSEDSITQTVRQFAVSQRDADGLVCISDAIAFLAISELLRQGISIPRDIALAGIGNQMFAGHPLMSLTTIDERRTDIGREAARLMLEMTDSASASAASASKQSIRLPGELIVRNSTAGLPISGMPAKPNH